MREDAKGLKEIEEHLRRARHGHNEEVCTNESGCTGSDAERV